MLDYFNLGLQRGEHTALPIVGETVQGPVGLTVQYQLLVEQGVISRVSFKATTCVTLVAYCEMLAQWATGMALREAVCIRAEELAKSLAGAPTCKRDRAWLAIQAMRYAVVAAVETSSCEKKEYDS